RSGAGEEPHEVEGALEGGARVCGDEAEVRICEATLSRTEEECHPTVRGVRAGESVLGAEKTVALGTGLARERRLLITGEPPKQAEDRKKPNPSACTGLAEHLLPQRHELIQSFPKSRICPSLRRCRTVLCKAFPAKICGSSCAESTASSSGIPIFPISIEVNSCRSYWNSFLKAEFASSTEPRGSRTTIPSGLFCISESK